MCVHSVRVIVSAESSISGIPGQTDLIPSQSGTLPIRFGIRTHLVLCVTADTTCQGAGTYVVNSTSQNFGTRPSCKMGATVVAKPHAGVTTSEPFGRSSAASASKIALLPEFTKRPIFLPKSNAVLFSNSSDRLPNPANQPSRRHSSTALISSSPYDSNLLGAYHIFLVII